MKKLTILFLSFFCVQFLSAQDIQSNTAGFSLNANLTLASWNSTSEFLGDLDELEPSGVGYGLKLGYGINQNVEIMLDFNSSTFSANDGWNTFQLKGFELGGRYNFGATLRKFRPFVEGGISLNQLAIDPVTFDGFEFYSLDLSGIGGAVGGGFHYFVLPNLGLSGSIKANFGNFDDVQLGGEEISDVIEQPNFTIVKIHLGVTYFFE